jgi:NADH dehydrogenase/NADH:ubiquinone oxidoreductase subunit G
LKNKGTKRVISIVLIFSVIAFFSSYIIYQIVASSNSKIKTEFALRDTVYESIDTQCFVVRDEKFINNDASGTTVSFVTNGERVASGDTVSVVFDSVEDASSFLQVQEIKKEIAHYEYISGQANVQTLNIDSLTKKIDSELTDYLKSVDNGDYKKAISKSALFRDSVIGKQIATGTHLDFNEKLEALKKDLDELQSEKYSYTEIKAEEAGYFISGSDGYEDLIDYNDIDNLTNENVEKALKAKPSKQKATPTMEVIISISLPARTPCLQVKASPSL